MNLKGEEIEIYPDHLLWTLEDGLYVKAGKEHWPDEVKFGKPSPGFSINKDIWNIIKTTQRDFIVKNSKQGKYYKLDKEKAESEAKDITRKDTELKLIPIYCCEVIDYE